MQDILRDWQSFYVVTGGAFRSVRTYVNPTLLHFVSVLIVSCVALVPTHTIASFSILVVRRMKSASSSESHEDNHWLWHGWLPFLSYGIGCAVAIGLVSTGSPSWFSRSSYVPFATCGFLFCGLLVSIRRVDKWSIVV